MAYRQNNDVFGKGTDLVGTKGLEMNLTKCIKYTLPLSARTRPEEDGHHQQPPLIRKLTMTYYWNLTARLVANNPVHILSRPNLLHIHRTQMCEQYSPDRG
jgi:hypothetical protein